MGKPLASALHQRGLVHAKANQLMPAVDDVTEAYKLDRSNTQCKAHMAQLAQKLAAYHAVHGPPENINMKGGGAKITEEKSA